jgi:hypothetical protein
MQNKAKPILSMIAIGVFLIMAAASFGPDSSTNTTVAIKDCMDKAPFQGKLKVTIKVEDTSVYVTGRLFISHQKVRQDTCEFDVVWSANELIAIPNGSGMYVYEGIDFIHDNSEDLFRVQVHLSASDGTFLDQTMVQKYQTADFHFLVKRKPKLTFNSSENCYKNNEL